VNPTISLPRTRNQDLRRRWACGIALEVRDAIRDTNLPFAVFLKGEEVHYESHPRAYDLTASGWTLVGIYDEGATLTHIADDVELVTEREPMHAAA
jgi:hypothetical protein